MREDLLEFYRKRDGVSCDRCGKLCLKFEINEISTPYQSAFMIKLCDDCGEKASSYVKYFGVKKKKDIERLLGYLKSGEHYQKVMRIEFSKTMNSGYYN